jgi:hypothetical protein
MRWNHIKLKFEVQKRVAARPLEKCLSACARERTSSTCNGRKCNRLYASRRPAGRHDAYTYGDIGHFYALVLGSNVCDKFYIYTLNAVGDWGQKSVTNCSTL